VTGYTWLQTGIASYTGNAFVLNRLDSSASLSAIVHFNDQNSIWVQESYNKVVIVPWYTASSIGYTWSLVKARPHECQPNTSGAREFITRSRACGRPSRRRFAHCSKSRLKGRLQAKLPTLRRIFVTQWYSADWQADEKERKCGGSCR
jgi:hypothetical protein